MTSREFQEKLLAHLDPDNVTKLRRLDAKNLEIEFQTVVQMLADAPEIHLDKAEEVNNDSLVSQISDRVTGNIINLFAPVLAKIESQLSKNVHDSCTNPEELPSITRADANTPIKRLVKHQGFTLGITHEKNTVRFPYSLPLLADYGHIRRSYGAAEDKKAIDIYWGGDDSATDVYKVRQIDPLTGFVAEHDYFMGFGGVDAPAAIKDLYFRHLGQKRFGGIEKVDPAELDQYRDAPRIDAIPEGHHWAKSDSEALLQADRVTNGGYVRRNWREKEEKTDGDNQELDAQNQDDWDDSDYIIDHTMQQSEKVFNRWIDLAQDWVSEQGSLEAARDNIAELYKQLDGEKLTQVLEQGMTLADLGGRLAVIEENAEDSNEADDRDK